MKKSLIVLSIFIINQALFSQVKEAYLTFEKLSHDFGTIKENDSIVKYKFLFTNTGKSPLIINDVKTSCGCTTPKYTKAPVLPGEKQFIEVGFNPKGRPGTFQKNITVISNARNQNVVLEIKGEVDDGKIKNPEMPQTIEEKYKFKIGNISISNNHVAFSNIFINEISSKAIDVYNPTDNSLVLSVKDLPKHITVKFIPETLKSKEEGNIIFTFDTKLKNDWGFVFDRVNLTINGETQNKDAISVSANIVENFGNLTSEEKNNAPIISFSNISHNFDTVFQFTKVSHKYAFENKGKTDLIIRKVKASCGCTASYAGINTIKPGGSSYIEAEFDAGGRKGKENKTITVISNDPERSTVILRFDAIVVPKSEH